MTTTDTNKHFKVTHNQATVLAVVLLLIINVLLFVSYSKLQSSNTQQNSIIAVNQQKTYKGISVKVTNITVETGYVMGIKPGVEEKIISVQLSISNDSKYDFEFYPTAQTFIRDNQGSQYIMAPVELSNPFPASILKPGDSTTGQLSYLVTNCSVPLFLYVESRQAEAGPFVIKIQ